jgi:hypothetical protein
MSRSNPNEGGSNNPATRYFEWNGEHGVVRYYDRDLKKNIDVGSDFTFILLDQLGSVRGWHDASDSGIYSNEVKDTRQEAMVVKAFKGGTLAEGIYRDIKDRVATVGGQFVTSLYLAYKDDDGALKIGVLRVKGAALKSWMDFSKANRADLYKKAIRIKGYTEGKKGKVVFRVPTLLLATITDDTNAVALNLDTELQQFFKSYFKRTKRDQVEVHRDEPAHVSDEEMAAQSRAMAGAELTDDDIPF